MEKVLETSGIDLIFGGLGWSLDELYTELKDMEELPVSLWDQSRWLFDLL